MGKAVVRQTIYQIAVIWLLILQGEVLLNIPYSVEYSQIQDSPDLVAQSLRNKSYHYTMLFHIFVLMSLFNLVSSRYSYLERKVAVPEKSAVCKSLTTFLNCGNPLFFLTLCLIVGTHFWLLESGKDVIQVTSLELGDHIVSLAVASGTIVWEAALKPIIRRLKARAKKSRQVEDNSGYTII